MLFCWFQSLHLLPFTLRIKRKGLAVVHEPLHQLALGHLSKLISPLLAVHSSFSSSHTGLLVGPQTRQAGSYLQVFALADSNAWTAGPTEMGMAAGSSIHSGLWSVLRLQRSLSWPPCLKEERLSLCLLILLYLYSHLSLYVSIICYFIIFLSL